MAFLLAYFNLQSVVALGTGLQGWRAEELNGGGRLMANITTAGLGTKIGFVDDMNSEKEEDWTTNEGSSRDGTGYLLHYRLEMRKPQ